MCCGPGFDTAVYTLHVHSSKHAYLGLECDANNMAIGVP